MLLLLCGFLNFVVIEIKLWVIAQKERKMGVLHHSSPL